MSIIIKKLNLAGRNILEYRKEYLKREYPEIVKKSLKSSAESIFIALNADLSIYDEFSNEAIDERTFREALLNSKCFSLSKKELSDETRKTCERIVKNLEENGVYGVEMNFSMEDEKYKMKFGIEMGTGFLIEYLGLTKENEKEYMKEGGVAETFAKLRLKKIGNSIINEYGEVLKDIGNNSKKDKNEKFLKLTEPKLIDDRYKIEVEYEINFETLEVDKAKEDQALTYKRFKNLADEYIEKRLVN